MLHYGLNIYIYFLFLFIGPQVGVKLYKRNGGDFYLGVSIRARKSQSSVPQNMSLILISVSLLNFLIKTALLFLDSFTGFLRYYSSQRKKK